MERPRPRPKHRSKKRESMHNHMSTKKDLSRPRPSLKTMKHRISSSHPTKKSVQLYQSKSPELKEETPIISKHNIKQITISQSTPASPKKRPLKPNKNDDILLHQLSKIKQHQKTRQSDFGKDFDEIKQFIHKQNHTSENMKSDLPTSLKLIGIRNVSSLLYHRQFDQQYVDKIHHHRAQSSIVSVNNYKNKQKNNNNNNNNTLNINMNDKYKHLRSYSSIMGTNQNKSQTHNRNDSVSYVKNAKNRQPSMLFGQNNNDKTEERGGVGIGQKTKSKKEILQELADEYESESDEENQNEKLDHDIIIKRDE